MRAGDTRTVLVIGGGPAGLGAALGARRAGADPVLVLERATDPGVRRRGETLRHDADVEALLHPGFFDRHTKHRVDRRRYFSPSGKKTVERRIDNPNRIIGWPDLLEDLTRLATDRGATVLRGAEATALELDGEGVRRVRWRDSGGEHTGEVGFVVAADGHDGLCARLLGQDRRRLDLPIRKTLQRGGSVDPACLEYHLHLEHGLPPLVGCIFPRGSGESEALIMAWGDVGGDAAGRARLLEAMRTFSERHPLFGRRLAGSEVFYSHETAIPMGGLVEPACPLPRLLIAGDLAGQVQARGGSGIVSSLALGHFAGELAGAVVRREDFWRPELMAALSKAMHEHPMEQRLRRMQRLLGRPRQRLLELLGSAEAFDRCWPALSPLLR